jgi:recombinational DNA repair protein RecT
MFSDDGIEYMPAPRDRGKIEYTILVITYMGAVSEFREIDIKPAEYGEKRREASKSKGTWKDWEDEMFIKTHVKHFANNFLDTSESFIEIGDIMEDEFTYSDQEKEETTTPALTIDAVKEANAVEEIAKTFDTKVIEPTETDAICNTLEGWTADENTFNEWYDTVITKQWKSFTKEEKDRITPLLVTVKNSFDKVTLDQIK